MSTPIRAVTETIGTLSEEAAKAAPKRTTYSQFKSREVEKAKLSDKVEEIQGTQAPEDMTAKTAALEEPMILSPYDYLLKYAFIFFEPFIFMKIFPIIIGALCVLLFYLIAKNFVKEKSALYSSIIFILSPTFLFMFSTNSAETITLFLMLLGVFLLIQKNKILSYISAVPIIIASLSGFFTAILAIVIYITYYLIRKEKKSSSWGGFSTQRNPFSRGCSI